MLSSQIFSRMIITPLLTLVYTHYDALFAFSFLLAVIINVLILIAYGTKTNTVDLGDNPRCSYACIDSARFCFSAVMPHETR
jgi:hypothetical protein